MASKTVPLAILGKKWGARKKTRFFYPLFLVFVVYLWMLAPLNYAKGAHLYYQGMFDPQKKKKIILRNS